MSDSDIIDLYKTKAYIIENGDIACGEFAEGRIDALVTEKSVFETAEVWESLTSQKGSRIEYVETNGNYFNTGIKATNNTKIIFDAAQKNRGLTGWLGLLGGDSY